MSSAFAIAAYELHTKKHVCADARSVHLITFAAKSPAMQVVKTANICLNVSDRVIFNCIFVPMLSLL